VLGVSAIGGNGVTGHGFRGSTGVLGDSRLGTGVEGHTITGTAVFGESSGDENGFCGPGVEGRSSAAPVGSDVAAAPGVRGSSNGNGCEGITFGFPVGAVGVSGGDFSDAPGAGVSGASVLGSGVQGFTSASLETNPDVAAVRGQSANGVATLFVGRVRVTGYLSNGGGGFTIDHPVDPANKYLSHSFVESSEMLNVYSGTVNTDDDGAARVELPPYFDALNRDFRYQLTGIGELARAIVSEEIKGNEFAIRTDVPRVKVCWQVTGVRGDAWAEAHRVPVVEDKPQAERGRYLHRRLFDNTAGIHPGPTTARPTELLPEELRDDAERLLTDLGSKDPAGIKDLHERLSRGRKWLEELGTARRARLEHQRRGAGNCGRHPPPDDGLTAAA
jgi:hypothetical protein